MSSASHAFVHADDRSLASVLLVSPTLRLRTQLRERINPSRWLLVEAASGASALEALGQQPVDVLLLDPALPDILPNEFQAIVLERFPHVELLSVDSQSGHLLLAGTAPAPLASQLTELMYREDSGQSPNASAFARHEPYVVEEPRTGIRGMVGDSEPMRQVYRMTQMVARKDTTVLITGESGTGKDLIAQAIHRISPRAKHPFAVVNCAAIPEALLEAELFGYAKGAFTGAMQSRIGRIHAAHGGTLFLDEIGDMPLSLQSKILRFLEQGEVQRLGGNDNLKVDVRVVAATNANLKTLAAQKLFREDLYYRLAVFPIELPALRDRHGDVERLVRNFAQKFCPGAFIHPEVFHRLSTHAWPGNVRELRNLIERASILLGDERELRVEHMLL